MFNRSAVAPGERAARGRACDHGRRPMQMSGMNALLSVAQHWLCWADPRIIVLVLNNRELSYVTWEQRVIDGDPKLGPSQDIPDFPYARFAELLGLTGIRVEWPDAVGPAWDEALAADRPVVLETQCLIQEGHLATVGKR
jgi:pyruvate dehydrogenase (quinone)